MLPIAFVVRRRRDLDRLGATGSAIPASTVVAVHDRPSSGPVRTRRLGFRLASARTSDGLRWRRSPPTPTCRGANCSCRTRRGTPEALDSVGQHSLVGAQRDPALADEPASILCRVGRLDAPRRASASSVKLDHRALQDLGVILKSGMSGGAEPRRHDYDPMRHPIPSTRMSTSSLDRKIVARLRGRFGGISHSRSDRRAVSRCRSGIRQEAHRPAITRGSRACIFCGPSRATNLHVLSWADLAADRRYRSAWALRVRTARSSMRRQTTHERRGRAGTLV